MIAPPPQPSGGATCHLPPQVEGSWTPIGPAWTKTASHVPRYGPPVNEDLPSRHSPLSHGALDRRINDDGSERGAKRDETEMGLGFQTVVRHRSRHGIRDRRLSDGPANFGGIGRDVRDHPVLAEHTLLLQLRGAPDLREEAHSVSRVRALLGRDLV